MPRTSEIPSAVSLAPRVANQKKDVYGAHRKVVLCSRQLLGDNGLGNVTRLLVEQFHRWQIPISVVIPNFRGADFGELRPEKQEKDVLLGKFGSGDRDEKRVDVFIVGDQRFELFPNNTEPQAFQAYQNYGERVAGLMMGRLESSSVIWALDSTAAFVLANCRMIGAPRVFTPFTMFTPHLGYQALFDYHLTPPDPGTDLHRYSSAVVNWLISPFLLGLTSSHIMTLWDGFQESLLARSADYKMANEEALRKNGVYRLGTDILHTHLNHDNVKVVALEFRLAMIRAIFRFHQIEDTEVLAALDDKNWTKANGKKSKLKKPLDKELGLILKEMGFTDDNIARHGTLKRMSLETLAEIIEFLNAAYFIRRGFVVSLHTEQKRGEEGIVLARDAIKQIA